jgi:cell pole-organizing protein PopZ
MSVNERAVLLKDVREFSVEAAEFIALAVARGESIRDLHENCEEMVPSPLVVNRWRKQYPAFDAVMREAEEAKAQTLADEVIKIADDEERQAAQAGNAIKARQWLAGKLAEKWGTAPVQAQAPVNITNMVTLSDEQLLAIAGSAIDGEYALVGKAVEEVGVTDTDRKEKGSGAVVSGDTGRTDGPDSESGGSWAFLTE